MGALPGGFPLGAHGEDQGGGGDDREHGHGGDELPEPAGAAPGRPVLVVLGGHAGIEEALLPASEEVGVAAGPLAGQGEPGAAVERAGIVVECLPGVGGVGELTVGPQVVPMVVEPLV